MIANECVEGKEYDVIPQLIKPQDAAKALGISPRKLQQLAADHLIPCVRIGRAVRFDPADLNAWIQAQKQTAPKAVADQAGV